MDKILIVYTSKYGSTSRYAKLLYEELAKDNDVTLSTLKEFKGKVKDYDTIIYAGGIKSYEIYNYEKFAKKIKRVDRECTRIVVLGVGMMSATREYAKRLVEINAVDKDFKFFYLRGAIDLDKLKGFDASIIKHLVSGLMMREDLTLDEKAFIGACLNSKDWVCKENIMPIVEYLA